MIRSTFLLVLISFACSSCSIYRVKSEEVTTNFYPSKTSVSDVVYIEEVTEPHEILGFVTVNTERRQSMEEVISKMKKEAAILGADAITDITTNATGTWKKVPLQKLMGNAYIRANFTATVINFKDSNDQSRAYPGKNSWERQFQDADQAFQAVQDKNTPGQERDAFEVVQEEDWESPIEVLLDASTDPIVKQSIEVSLDNKP